MVKSAATWVGLIAAIAGLMGLAGCSSTEAVQPDPAVQAKYTLRYQGLSMDNVAADMAKVVECANSSGLKVTADLVTGGYYYELPSGNDEKAAQQTLRKCNSKLPGDPFSDSPKELSVAYQLYETQRECLATNGLKLASLPSKDEFGKQLHSDQGWGLMARHQAEVVDWAKVRGLTVKDAERELLTQCPDPIRAWRYVYP